MVKSLYISRSVINAEEVLTWANKVGIFPTVNPDDLHVTVCYSKSEVDWDKIPSVSDRVNTSFSLEVDRSVERFEGGAIVLCFRSDDLYARHAQLTTQCGASHDFPEYKTHITLSYEPLPNLDLTFISPYEGEIILGPEVFAPIDEDWADDVIHVIPRSEAQSGVSSKMQMPTGAENSQIVKKVSMSAKIMTGLAKIFKSMPEGMMRDLEQVVDYTDNKDYIPNNEEFGIQKETLQMRGADADRQVRASSTGFAKQEGIAEDYEKFARAFGDLKEMKKALGIMAKTVQAVLKAGETEEKTDEEKHANPFKKAEDAVRKSRLALRKAEDEDDDEDKKDAMEKAERLIKAAKEAILKAEDDDDDMDDDKEDRMDKARKALRTIKASLDAVRKADADKVAKAVKDAADAVAKAEADKVAKAEADEAEAAAKKAMESPDFAALKAKNESLTSELGIMQGTVADLMKAVQGQGTNLPPAPAFMKSITKESVKTVEDAIEDNETLPMQMIVKAKGLTNMLRAVEAGTFTKEAFDQALGDAPDEVQSFFKLAA